MSCNCHNMGSACGGCGNDTLATMQQGKSFPVYLEYKEDDLTANITKADDIIIAFYDYKSDLIMKGSVWDGKVKFNLEKEWFEIEVTHNDSVRMVGRVTVELTITRQNGEVVYHGDKVVKVDFEPRLNNEIIHHYEKEDD